MKKYTFLTIICLLIHFISCSTDKNPMSTIHNNDLERKIIGVWSEERNSNPYSAERSIFIFSESGTFTDSVFFYSNDTLLHHVIEGCYSIDDGQLKFTNFSFTFIDTVNFNTSIIQKFYNYSKIELIDDSILHLFRFQKLFSDDNNSDEIWGLWKEPFWSAIFARFYEPQFSSGTIEYSYYFDKDSAGTLYNSYTCFFSKHYLFDAPFYNDTLRYDVRVFPPYFYFWGTTAGVIEYEIKSGTMSWFYIEQRPKYLRKIK